MRAASGVCFMVFFMVCRRPEVIERYQEGALASTADIARSFAFEDKGAHLAGFAQPDTDEA